MPGDEQARVTAESELQDARWIKKEWFREKLVGKPAGGAQMSIPAHASLARRLSWSVWMRMCSRACWRLALHTGVATAGVLSCSRRCPL